MGRPPSTIWQYAINKKIHKKNFTFDCMYCLTTFTGSASVLTDHLIGQGTRRRPCKRVPKAISKRLKREEIKKKIQDQMKKKHGKIGQNTTSRDGSTDKEEADFRGLINYSDEGRGIETDGSFSDEEYSHSLGIGQVEQRTPLRELQAKADKSTRQYFYAHAVPFSLASSPHFVNMCRAINKLPPGMFEIPSLESLKGAILMAEKEDLKNKLTM